MNPEVIYAYRRLGEQQFVYWAQRGHAESL